MISKETGSYTLYDNNLEKTDYISILREIVKNDIIFFGETHNSTAAHELEIKLAEDIFGSVGKHLTIGAEMFESDDQLVIDEYLAEFYDENKFKSAAKIWPNYETDYRPLIEFAKEKNLKFIATNIPRRYASMVSLDGFEALNKLSDKARSYIAELPIEFDPELSGYRMIIENMGKMGHMKIDPVKLAKAQAVKDATMAHFIVKNYNHGDTFYHINGSYHSFNREGIIWYLNKKLPDLKIYSITVVSEKEFKESKGSYKNTADMIMVLPEGYRKSY